MTPAADPPAGAAQTLDLRGERCPYTFIKSRLALEDLPAGAVLEVWLDFPPAFRRVPASLGVLGYGFLGEAALAGGARALRFRKTAGTT